MNLAAYELIGDKPTPGNQAIELSSIKFTTSPSGEGTLELNASGDSHKLHVSATYLIKPLMVVITMKPQQSVDKHREFYGARMLNQ